MELRPPLDQVYWAPGTGLKVIALNETTLLNYGATVFYGVWWSPALWKDPEHRRLAELNSVTLKYRSYGASSFLCSASGDGGETWRAPLNGSEIITTATQEDGVDIETVEFNWVQGHHILFRICFDQPEIIVVKGAIAEFIVRGKLRYKELIYGQP